MTSLNTKRLTVCKSNSVIEAAYRLSLNEQRIVLACIGQVDSKKQLLVTDCFELSAKDFAILFGISEDNAYSELQEVARNLYQRSLTIYNPYPEKPDIAKLETRWISSIAYMPTKGKIVLRFASDLLPYLGELRGQFTKYKLEHIGKMTSIYAIRLYELLAQWQNTGRREIELEWLKQQFEITDKYSSIKDLKKYVIDVAIKDINENSNFTVSWIQRKTGRRVTHLTFIFADKAVAKPEKPKAKHKKKFTAAEWHEYVRVNARIGESWAQAAARLKDTLDKAQTA